MLEDAPNVNSQSTTPIAQIDPVPRVSIQAFCESPEAAAVIQAAIGDRRMAKAHVKQNMGGAAGAVEAYRNAPTPNVIVIEATADREFLVSQLDELSEYCDAGTKVIIIGKVNDIILYRQLIARGVSEYLVLPFGVVDFVSAVSQLFKTPGAKPLGRVIAVVGAKGGVGSSTIAHNVAWHLATEIGMDTIIADLDLGFGTAGLDFNQDPPQGVAEAVFAPDRVDTTLVDRLLSKCGDNLHLLAAPAMLDRLYDFGETAFDSLMDSMRASTPWVVLDIPHGWNAWTRRTLVAADEVMVIAQPDLANLRNAKNIVDNIRSARPHDHPPRLILNNVGIPKRPEIPVADFSKTIEMEPTAIIAHDAKLFGSAANNGQMIAEIEPKGKVAETFAALAGMIAGRTEVKKQKRGLFDPLLAKLTKKA
ncbi:MAG: AAA family ATPase [Pseudomonadota bacterium]|nr:AAA family ATPase [Pseudomonadota bacterium]